MGSKAKLAIGNAGLTETSCNVSSITIAQLFSSGQWRGSLVRVFSIGQVVVGLFNASSIRKELRHFHVEALELHQ